MYIILGWGRKCGGTHATGATVSLAPMCMRLSINGVTNLGGRGLSAKRRHYSISLFREMGDKGERGS